MERLFEVSSGIDVHRDTVVVSIRKLDGRREHVETRTFETFHDSLVAMTRWLAEHDVSVVGLESTGVYWKPVVRVIKAESSRRVVWLVNPADVKKVPGRKTDVNDSQWLSKLVMHGLVRPSFLATPEMEELRSLTRHRTRLVAERTASKNRIIKQLESAGIKLATVCSKPLGVSGRAMLDAVLEGSMTPSEIAGLAKGSLRSKRAEIERAVCGSFSDAARFVLRQLVRRLDEIGRDIIAVDSLIQERLQPHQRQVELLLTAPGLDRVATAAVLAETGPDMSPFDSADKLAAWSGLAPGSNESAGRSGGAPARKGDKYLRTALVQAAWSAVKMKGTHLRRKFGQLAPRLGPKKAIVAIARKMLVSIYYQLRDGVPYREPAPMPPGEDKLKRLVRRKKAELEALGFVVTIAPQTNQIVPT